MHRIRIISTRVLTTVGALVLLAGCGDEGVTNTSSGDSTSSSAPSTSVDGAVPPASVEAFCEAYRELNHIAEPLDTPQDFESAQRVVTEMFDTISQDFSNAADVAPPEIRDDVLIAVSIFENAAQEAREAENLGDLVAASRDLSNSLVDEAGQNVTAY